MIDLCLDKTTCCGCTSCANICPQKAITMEKDEKGFYYPHIDRVLCIECGRCLNVCDFKKKHENIVSIKKVFAFQHKDKKILKHSSSGGFFTYCSDIILADGGVVYGSVFSEKFNAIHVRSETKEGRNRMRGSKYVQSYMNNILPEIRTDLLNGRKVLFTGTPCQCAAVCSYLGGHPENLTIVDLLCHGTPSNDILKEHIRFWENKKHKKAINYEYRSKKYGCEYTNCIFFDDGTSNSSINLKRLIKLFSKTMRPSCYSCPYASMKRYGDITIGDMWEASKLVGIYNHRGVSTVLSNSRKGLEIIENAFQSGFLKEISLSNIEQDALRRPVEYKEIYDSLWTDYLNNGYKYIMHKYAPYTILSWGYSTLWRILYFTKLDRLALYLKGRKK